MKSFTFKIFKIDEKSGLDEKQKELPSGEYAIWYTGNSVAEESKSISYTLGFAMF